jgi:hypothetical protein
MTDRLFSSRAVDAAIWGMPIVSFDALRQAYFRDAKARYNDIAWWPKGSGWKNQSLTPNTTVRYMYIFINTEKDGPVFVELPGANDAGSFYGTFEDAWQVPLLDVGMGGKGGKFLVLPPNFVGIIPDGCIAVKSKTYNTLLPLRSIVASKSAEAVAAADALVEKVRVYPLSAASSPHAQRFIDMTDIRYDGLVKFDATLYASLSRMVNEEPVQARDLQMMGMVLRVGIRKGAEFAPDADTIAQLDESAAAAHEWLVAQLPTFITPWWPESRWIIPAAPIAPKSAFTWETAEYFDVESRGIAFSTFFAPPVALGGGSFYLGTYNDSDAQPLDGSKSYRLHVPANVPVSDFWAVTVYDVETSAFFLGSTRLSVDSLDQNLEKNADGSVDIFFGPTPLPGHESNWLFTEAGRAWTPWFRFYGPEKALFDKTWTMPDITCSELGSKV